MSSIDDSYQDLLSLAKRLAVLRSAGGILHWDLETKMPARGIEQRAEELALLNVLAHQILIDKKTGKLLSTLTKERTLASMGEVEKRNVFLMKRTYDEEVALPERLVEALTKQSAITVDQWKKARAARDFSIYRSELEKMFELRKESATILKDVKNVSSNYDALLDLYEPGMSSDKISSVFNGMREGLTSIIERVTSSDNQPDRTILSRRLSVEKQRDISKMAMSFIDYKFRGPDASGRLDETEHPFTVGHYNDVRITTHYHEERFMSSLFSVLHEGGHALYEQSLPHDWIYQPIGNPCSYGIHESQSRFVENIIGRSPEFLSYILPHLKSMTGILDDVSENEFILAVNAVAPSKIRIEADEVTYGLHIIIRFELEKEIMADKLSVSELPQAWNEKYQEYLGVDVQNDSEGVMQDTHWAGGSIGYFPSYALGNLYGGMFLRKMEQDIPEWRNSISRGDYEPVRSWLANNIHSKGNMYDPADLIEVVTGKSLEVDPFIDYLNEKIEAIYDN
ncbi:MAG: carboxypeptidase M32 [Euryarchaeota archaeon]|nr:carboxypeptidase M32 [Euryarchaeota archaeon]